MGKGRRGGLGDIEDSRAQLVRQAKETLGWKSFDLVAYTILGLKGARSRHVHYPVGRGIRGAQKPCAHGVVLGI